MKQIANVLGKFVSPILVDPIIESAVERSAVNVEDLRPGDGSRLMKALKTSVKLFIRNISLYDRCTRELEKLLADGMVSKNTMRKPTLIPILEERDIVIARATGKGICEELGFSLSIQVGVSTVISELARNIFQYAGKGEVEIRIINSDHSGIEVIARDDGPGIEDLRDILKGTYKSKTGMGRGLITAKKMMDEFEIASTPGKGTRVCVRKFLNPRA